MIDREINAQRLKELLVEISPLIEEYTAQTCPTCREVCCKQRRGIMDPEDLCYISALKEPVPVYDPSRMPDGPCQFMDKLGCVTPRWLRPWRCTWYFCDPLLDAVKNGPPKKARKISLLIQQIIDIRGDWQ